MLWRGILLVFLLTSVSKAAEAPISLDLKPAGGNPASPVMGDHLQFRSTLVRITSYNVCYTKLLRDVPP